MQHLTIDKLGPVLRAEGYELVLYKWDRKTGFAEWHYERDGDTIQVHEEQPRYKTDQPNDLNDKDWGEF